MVVVLLYGFLLKKYKNLRMLVPADYISKMESLWREENFKM